MTAGDAVAAQQRADQERQRLAGQLGSLQRRLAELEAAVRGCRGWPQGCSAGCWAAGDGWLLGMAGCGGWGLLRGRRSGGLRAPAEPRPGC